MAQTISLLSWGFDVLLGVMLLWLAHQLLTTSILFKAVVLYIAFGLLMSLSWIRLKAPDIALAEAAIGAGLAGALFLTTLRRMDVSTESDPEKKQENNND